MVRVKDPENYRLLRFEKSNSKNKMYDAILLNKITNKEKRIPFGDNRMENYKDIKTLGLYPHLVHNNKERRRLYRLRHEKNSKYKYSSAYFSYYYLW
jgi:hypothetical protein